MPNSRALITALVVAAAAVALWAWLSGPAAAHVPAEVPGTARDVDGQVDRATAAAPLDPRAEPERVRVAVDDLEGFDDVCRLTVLLRTLVADSERPAPFADVALLLPDRVAPAKVGRTDRGGRVTFALAGAAGMRIVLRSGLGGTASATIGERGAQTVELVVPARVLTNGRVVQTGSAPVPFADLVLLHWGHDAADPGALWHIGRADADGRFDVPLHAGGRLGARHPDFADSAMYLVRPRRGGDPDAMPPTQTFELQLLATRAFVQGTVVDAANAPVAFAEVEVQSTRTAPSGAELAGPPARGRCDADGRFQLDGVAAGPARWTARADGFGWKVDHGELQTGRNHELRIALPPASSIRGRIEAATDGKPVANAVVAAGDPGTLAHRATRTGADGRYTLHSLGSGDVEVRAAHAVGRARGAVAVPAGGEARWDAVLGDAAGEDFVHGVVVDQQQRPLEGWSIVVRQKGHDPVARATDAQGRFRVPVARPDHLDVRAFAPGRLLTSFADAMARDQQAGTPVRLQVDTSATTSVAGRVLDASAAGAPATIGCWHYQRREYARYTADAEGRFTIPRAPLGTIDLTIEHPGHVAHETGAIELQRGLPVDLGTIHLSLGGGLHGQVLGPGGTAPPACTLTLVQQGSARQLNAEYDGGGYRFRGVPAGQHTLLVQGERIAGAALPVTIEPGVDTPLDLEIQLGLHRRVQVRVPPGGGRRVTLALRASASDVRWIATGEVARASERADGVATFETWMLAGSYEVVAATDAGHQGQQQIRFATDATGDVTLRVAPR